MDKVDSISKIFQEHDFSVVDCQIQGKVVMVLLYSVYMPIVPMLQKALKEIDCMFTQIVPNGDYVCAIIEEKREAIVV